MGKKLLLPALVAALVLPPTAAQATYRHDFSSPPGSVTIDIPDGRYIGKRGCIWHYGTMTTSTPSHNEWASIWLTGNVVSPNGSTTSVLEIQDDNVSQSIKFFLCSWSDKPGLYTFSGTVERKNYETGASSTAVVTETFYISKGGRKGRHAQAKKCKKIKRNYRNAIRRGHSAKASNLRARGTGMGCSM